jgi:hypothetical protein
VERESRLNGTGGGERVSDIDRVYHGSHGRLVNHTRANGHHLPLVRLASKLCVRCVLSWCGLPTTTTHNFRAENSPHRCNCHRRRYCRRSYRRRPPPDQPRLTSAPAGLGSTPTLDARVRNIARCQSVIFFSRFSLSAPMLFYCAGGRQTRRSAVSNWDLSGPNVVLLESERFPVDGDNLQARSS